MRVVSQLVTKNKYWLKCPYHMDAEFVVVHNTAEDASARAEIAYMTKNNLERSYHYAVDDKEAVQGLKLNRNGWHAGDGKKGRGNRKGIGIEICYSKSGGKRFYDAEKNAAKLIAQLLNDHGWGIGRVFKHQDFANKYCPHRTLNMGWGRFLDMIQFELDALNKPQASDVPEWAKEHWDNAKKKGITDGARPNDATTRAELVTILGRLDLFA